MYNLLSHFNPFRNLALLFCTNQSGWGNDFPCHNISENAEYFAQLQCLCNGYVLKQIDFSNMEVHEDIPEYKTYRTLVNHLLEGLADTEEGKVQDFQ